MATFLTTHGLSWHIETLINNARQRLFLVSPKLQLSGTLLQSIQSVGQIIPTSIIFRDNNLADDLLKKLKNISKLTLLHNPDLYAGCYFNEQTMVLTSMSLSDDQKDDHWEMGILIDRELDASLYQSAINEVIKIADTSNIVNPFDSEAL